jgi:hypothetical protein
MKNLASLFNSLSIQSLCVGFCGSKGSDYLAGAAAEGAGITFCKTLK